MNTGCVFIVRRKRHKYEASLCFLEKEARYIFRISSTISNRAISPTGLRFEKSIELLTRTHDIQRVGEGAEADARPVKYSRKRLGVTDTVDFTNIFRSTVSSTHRLCSVFASLHEA